LRRAQDQVSRSSQKAATLEQTLEVIVDYYLKRKDPNERAKRVRIRAEQRPDAVPTAPELGRRGTDPKLGMRISAPVRKAHLLASALAAQSPASRPETGCEREPKRDSAPTALQVTP